MAQTQDESKTPIAAGETVTWTSQATGSAKKKTGTVVCHVPAGTSLRAALRLKGLHAHQFSDYARTRPTYVVLVERVNRNGDKLDPRYYTPLASVLERQNPKAKRV